MAVKNQKEKAELFLKLHHDEEILVLVNTWDAGSSRLIEASGFKALATTSMGVSAALGYPDGQAIPFNEMLEAIGRITKMVNLPVTVDIEGGYGKNTAEITESIKQIIQTGVVGINFEDSYGIDQQLMNTNEFCERISAIRALSDSLGFHLVINARTDVFLASWGSPEKRLPETIRRGNIYIEAGADCIFVPYVWEKDMISVLVKEIKAPINILSNPTIGTGAPPSINELQDMGVARVSYGASVMKGTLSLIKRIADEAIQKGTYNVLSEVITPVSETTNAYNMAVGKR
jgi:2-methylisocitrate lyase-like PEP mutase family enzyme